DSVCQGAYDTCTGGGAVAQDGTTDETKSMTVGQLEMNFYPNPSDGTFINIEFSEMTDDIYNLRIVDMTGKVIHSEQINPAKNLVHLIEFQNGKLSQGMYMVNMLDGDKIFSSRFVVE
ncbi:MAG: T9SS type A sorting domain-containing protein, partial [Flavobacteriales bacterium]|nr:T9SS type A sorting domain-containing protein [Flavobacteriales bacterium]